MSTVSFLDYVVNADGLTANIDEALALVKGGRRGGFVSTINAHSSVEAESDAAFKAALQHADVLIPDGISVVLASSFLGQPVKERVTGYDFFWAFSQRAQEVGDIRYFFLGSSEKTLSTIVAKLAKDFPNIQVVGTLSPPFKPEFTEDENVAMCDAVNKSGANVLWVGMTAPKQEKWIQANRHRLNTGFAAAIGAVFDFYAGTKSRAPQWMQQYGLEWFHRLCSEPRRVWRRYIINNPRFIWLVIKQKFVAK